MQFNGELQANVRPEQRGLILQRGGEELLLVRSRDRFTVRLAAAGTLAALQNQLQPLDIRALPTGRLVEVTVAPERLEAQMSLARQSPLVAFASHVYTLAASPQTFVYLGDQITVQFAAATAQGTIETLAADLGLVDMQPLAGVSHTYIFRVAAEATENPIKLANRLMGSAAVLIAEPDVIVQTQALYRPRDPFYQEQWYLHHEGGTELTPNSHIGVETAWETTRGIRSVVVAVIDDGFDLYHPDFQGIGKLVAPRDLQGADFSPLPEAAYENHGTAVAGIAIAEENGQGIVGVAPGCAFMPIRNTGYIDDATIEQLFSWAANQGADVICCSWGVGAIYFPLSLRQRLAIHRAATEGREGKGCVITFAAGNANRPISGEIEEIGWSQANVKGKTTWLNGFAVHPDVIAVAACTSLGRKAAYSNWGKQIAIAAPSNNAPPGAWLPNVGEVLTGPPVTEILKGRGIFTSDRMASLGYALGNFTDNFGGTSSACPVVAGVAALVLSVNPDLTAAEVKELLQRTADKLVDPTPDPQLKLRKGTYSAQGHSEWLGYGKVNAARAVQEALRLRPAPQAATTEIQRRHQTAMSIPDDDAVGIQSQIVINDNQEIRALEVWVDIEHSFLGDVEIYLVPPQRSAILLQGRTLGRQTQLQTTYSITTTPNLSQMLGQPAQGRWQLWIRDRAPQNTGQLNQWQLTIGF